MHRHALPLIQVILRHHSQVGRPRGAAPAARCLACLQHLLLLLLLLLP